MNCLSFFWNTPGIDLARRGKINNLSGQLTMVHPPNARHKYVIYFGPSKCQQTQRGFIFAPARLPVSPQKKNLNLYGQMNGMAHGGAVRRDAIL